MPGGLSGTVYGGSAGDRAQSMRKMLVTARQRAQAIDHTDDPHGWAMAQHHLGAVLSRQLLGDPAALADEAVIAFEAAARTHHSLGDLRRATASMTSLGAAWKNRVTGDRRANLEQALRCQQQALAWSAGMTGAAGAAGVNGAAGVKGVAARSVRADVHANLGQCYHYRVAGDRRRNLLRAVRHLRAAMTWYGPERAPTKWAILKTTEGITWARFPDTRIGLRRAARAFRQAASVLDTDAYPAHARRLGRTAGALSLRRGHWQSALSYFEMAVAARVRLLGAAVDQASQRSERADLGDLMCRAAYAAARAGRPDRALVLAEQGRASMFRSVVGEEVGPAGEPEEPEPQQDTAVCYLLSTPVGGGILVNSAPGPVTFIEAGKLTLDAVEKVVARTVPPPGRGGSVAERLVAEREDPLEVSLEAALEWCGTAALAEFGHWLRSSRVRRVVLIAYGPLAVLPLHLAPLQLPLPVGASPLNSASPPAATAPEARTLADRVPVTYVPSAAALRLARRNTVAVARPPRLLAVQLPQGSGQVLRAAAGEVEAVGHAFPGESIVLRPDEATRANLLELLPRVTHLHLAGHGNFHSASVEDSHFALTGEDRLTLSELMSGRVFRGIRLVMATACSMAASDYLRLPDEAVGFPAALILSGAGGVIAPLRPVLDIPAALLAARFYRTLGRTPTPEPAEAFADAQRWLRDLTARQLRRFVDDNPALLSYVRQNGRDATAPAEIDDVSLWRQYPELWASFCYIGT